MLVNLSELNATDGGKYLSSQTIRAAMKSFAPNASGKIHRHEAVRYLSTSGAL